jgi:hypothetical protein
VTSRVSLVLVAAVAWLAQGCADDSAPRKYALRVHVIGPGGVGSLDHRINCTETCDRDPICDGCGTGEVYDSGETVPLVASPDPEHPLIGVTGAICDVANPECIVTMNVDQEVTFTFEP